MDITTTEAMDTLEQLINDKRAQYAGVKGMEGFLAFLDQTFAETSARMLIGEADADYFMAVCEDVKQQEWTSRVKADLLTPEEKEAHEAFMKWFKGPCDLPPEVK